MTAIYYLTIFFFLFVSTLLCGVILLQESKTSGLGASFGGDAGESVFGTATAEVLKKITVYLCFGFLALCILLSMWTAKLGRGIAPEPTYQIESNSQ